MKNSFLLILLVLVACQPVSKNKVRVAVAANAQYALAEIGANFEKKTGIVVELIVSSSGKLSAQIERGAPVDIFLSADLKYPKYLAEKGLTVGDIDIYAKGALVLWTMDKEQDLKKGLQILLDKDIVKIAIADPQTAPYGELALNQLKESGIYSQIESKLVYGNSISQVNQYISTQSVSIGISAKSSLMAPHLKGQGAYISLQGKQIEQGAVVLKKGMQENGENTMDFYDYLLSDEVRIIFEKYGYQ